MIMSYFFNNIIVIIKHITIKKCDIVSLAADLYSSRSEKIRMHDMETLVPYVLKKSQFLAHEKSVQNGSYRRTALGHDMTFNNNLSVS